MTPREKLIENIIDIVHATHGTPNDEKMAHFVKLLVATLKTHYAIGKWVPVSERLPKFDENGRWAGCFQSDTNTYFGVFTCHVFQPEYHWLELDIPEVES